MKGSNEFIYFLVAGLMIIAVMIAMFSLEVEECTNCKDKEKGYIEVIKTFTIPRVEASNTLNKMSATNFDKTIFSGLLFGEDKIVYNISKTGLQDITISFNVKATNYYGKLIVRANGNTLEAKNFDPGYYEITVPAKIVTDHTVIEIYAESSAWRIWAPALYELVDVDIEFTSYSSAFSQYKFYLGEEYEKLEFAKVDLAMAENVGTLLVDINGLNVWSSPVADEQSIILEKSDLRLGDNIIGFAAAEDGTFLGRGVIVVIYLTQYPETINQSGIVTAVQPVIGVSSQFYG